MRRSALVLFILASAALLASSAALAESYTCVCTKDVCGRESGKGAEGKGGKVVKDIDPDDLKRRFGLEKGGRNGNTGWTCLVEQAYTCECKGKKDLGHCGGKNKDAVGTTRDVPNAETAIKWFNPEKDGKSDTGWVCKPKAAK